MNQRRAKQIARRVALIGVLAAGPALAQEGDRQQRCGETAEPALERTLAEPFEGVTANGEPVYGLFPIASTSDTSDESTDKSTDKSIGPIVTAAKKFLSTLSADQRAETLFPVDDPEWRKWMAQRCYARQGIRFADMDENQREAALGLLKSSLSRKGFKLTRDIMRLNHTLGERNANNFEEFDQWLYWITVMGEPSATEPWGWQLDGHHAVINYFVLGDQIVMSPVLLGSEPVSAESGKYAGTTVLQAEQDQGLAMLRSLTDAQQQMAIVTAEGDVANDGNNIAAAAFKDNARLENVGIPGALLDTEQREALLALVELYVGNLRPADARIKMEQVKAHLDATYFAWVGNTAATRDKPVFYYRIFSPVILIEFEHRLPAGLRQPDADPKKPSRQHIHTIVRTPNGNDYGRALLRQYKERQSRGD